MVALPRLIRGRALRRDPATSSQGEGAASVHQSIILKVQAEAQDRNVPLASILSRARIAARRLSLPGVPDWLEKETDGYGADDELPPYRIVECWHEFRNPMRGWCPIVHEGAQPVVGLFQSVYELEELLHGASSGYLTAARGPVRMDAYGSALTFPTRYRFTSMEVSRALGMVRRLILDWTIALESAGVLGDGTMFTASERTEAYSVTQNFIAQNQSIGVAGNVSGGTNTIAANQTSDGGMDVRKVRDFLAETSGLIAHLPSAVRDEMREVVAEAQAEAGKANPDGKKVGKALAVIKDLGMRAGGGVIASGIVSGVGVLLS